jgi:hypothetical protein
MYIYIDTYIYTYIYNVPVTATISNKPSLISALEKSEIFSPFFDEFGELSAHIFAPPA